MLFRSLRAAQKALSLDSTNANAHAAQAYIDLAYEWDMEAAERETRRALALDPRDLDAHMWLAEVLWARGARDSALVEDANAVRADPVSSFAAGRFAYDLIAARQLDSAERVLRRVRDFEPGFSTLATTFATLRVAQGRWADGLEELKKVGAFESYAEALGAICEARLGHLPELRRRIAALEAARGKHYVDADDIALAYVALGDHDAAFRWLDQAFQDRASGMIDMTVFIWDPIRADPRFRALEQRVRAARGAP